MGAWSSPPEHQGLVAPGSPFGSAVCVHRICKENARGFPRTPPPSVRGSMINLSRPASVRCSTLPGRCKPRLLRQHTCYLATEGLVCGPPRPQRPQRKPELTACRQGPYPRTGMLSRPMPFSSHRRTSACCSGLPMPCAPRTCSRRGRRDQLGDTACEACATSNFLASRALLLEHAIGL